VVGDHLGFEAATRDRLGALGASPLSVGPESLHSEDAIAVLHNELDRCGA
jgi:tRNA pseudouridine-54 N-methylase